MYGAIPADVLDSWETIWGRYSGKYHDVQRVSIATRCEGGATKTPARVVYRNRFISQTDAATVLRVGFVRRRMKPWHNEAWKNGFSVLEQQLAKLQVAIANGAREKDWRRTIGMFTDDPGMQELLKEAMKIREADRARARRRYRQSRRSKS